MLKELFQASYFRMTVVPDGQTVEVCGALKVSFSLIHSFFHLLNNNNNNHLTASFPGQPG